MSLPLPSTGLNLPIWRHSLLRHEPASTRRPPVIRRVPTGCARRAAACGRRFGSLGTGRKPRSPIFDPSRCAPPLNIPTASAMRRPTTKALLASRWPIPRWSPDDFRCWRVRAPSAPCTRDEVMSAGSTMAFVFRKAAGPSQHRTERPWAFCLFTNAAIAGATPRRTTAPNASRSRFVVHQATAPRNSDS